MKISDQKTRSILVSYRHNDSAGHTGRMLDRIKKPFAKWRLQCDVDLINPGDDFVQVIEDAIATSDVMLVVIGRDWLISGEGSPQSRLDNPTDVVRLEIAYALAHQVRIIPILVKGAAMPPSAALPDELKGFARRQSIELRDTRWEADIDDLIAALKKVLMPGRGQQSSKFSSYRYWALLAAFCFVIGSTGLFVWTEYGRREHIHAREAESQVEHESASPSEYNLVIQPEQTFTAEKSVEMIAPVGKDKLASILESSYPKSDKGVTLWNLKTGENENIIESLDSSNPANISNPSAITATSEEQLIFGYWGYIKIWNPIGRSKLNTIRTKKKYYELTGATIVQFEQLPDGRLLSKTYEAGFAIWDIEKMKGWGTWEKEDTSEATSAAMLADGRLVFGKSNGMILLWDQLKQKKTTIKPEDDEINNDINNLMVLGNNRLISGSNNGTVTVWNLDTGKSKELRKPDHYSGPINFSFLGEDRVAVLRDNIIEIWNLSNGEPDQPEKVSQVNKDWISTFLLVQGYLLVASEKGDISAWSISSARTEAVLTGHTKKITQIIQLPDGRIASASKDRTIRLWNLAALHSKPAN